MWHACLRIENYDENFVQVCFDGFAILRDVGILRTEEIREIPAGVSRVFTGSLRES